MFQGGRKRLKSAQDFKFSLRDPDSAVAQRFLSPQYAPDYSPQSELERQTDPEPRPVFAAIEAAARS